MYTIVYKCTLLDTMMDTVIPVADYVIYVNLIKTLYNANLM